MGFAEETRSTWDGTPLPRRISLPFTFRAGMDFIDAPLAACCERESINSPGTMEKRNADAY